MSEPAIKEAMKSEMCFTQDEKLRRKYEIQEKARRDYISMMYNIERSREEARAVQEKLQAAEGKLQAAEEKLQREQEKARIAQEETVLGLLREGLSYDMISRVMKIPMEKIQEIAEKEPVKKTL